MKFLQIHLLWLFLLVCPNAFSALTVSNLVLPPSSVAKYAENTIRFTLSGAVYSSPYNYNEISIRLMLISPSNVTHYVDGYYYTSYTQNPVYHHVNDPFPCEILQPTGNNEWRIHFTLPQTGTWRYRILISNSTHNPSIGLPVSTLYYNINVTNSSDPGFIKVRDKRFKYDNGGIYFPIGQNLAFSKERGGNKEKTFGTYQYETRTDVLEANGIDFIRILLGTEWGFTIHGYDLEDGEHFYLGEYNQKDLWRLDKVFDMCKAKNIKIQLTLSDGGQFKHTPNGWPKNPYNPINGGPVSGGHLSFFSDPAAKSVYKNYLRYMISRFGHRTNLFGWEFFNEVNALTDSVAGQYNNEPYPGYFDEVISWHQEMYNYIRQYDINEHVISTSMGGGLGGHGLSELWNHMDYMTTHDYKNLDSTNSEDNFPSHFYSQRQICKDEYNNKPYMANEFGQAFDLKPATDIDPHGFDLHATLLSSLVTGIDGTPMMWWWDVYLEQDFISKLHYHYIPVRHIVDNYELFEADENLVVYNRFLENGMRIHSKSNQGIRFAGWVQDTNFVFSNLRDHYPAYLWLTSWIPPAPASVNNTFTLNANETGNYLITWIDPSTGLQFSQYTIYNSNPHALTLEIPVTLRTRGYGDAFFIAELVCEDSKWHAEQICSECTPYNGFSELSYSNIKDEVFYVSGGRIKSLERTTGNTWEFRDLIYSGSNNTTNDIETDYNNRVFFVTTDNKIHSISHVAGTTWSRSDLNGAVPGNARDGLQVAPNDQLYYITTSSAVQMLWFNGSSWIHSDMNNAVPSGVKSNISLVPTSNNIFFVNTSNQVVRLYWSTNWQTEVLVTVPNAWDKITAVNDNTLLVSTTTGALVRVIRQGTSWLIDPDFPSSPANFSNTQVPIVNAVNQYFYINNGNTAINNYWLNPVTSNYQHSDLDYATTSASKIAYGGNDIIYSQSNGQFFRLYYASSCEGYNDTGLPRPSLNLEENKTGLTAELSLYPNPSQDYIEIRSATVIENYTLKDGKLSQLYMKSGIGSTDFRIDVSALRPGLYLLIMNTADGVTITRKFIKH